jgi:hypothetical protein
MGREVRRVPLDFSLPIGTIWPGFLLQNYLPKCANCDGDGSVGHGKDYADCPDCQGHGNIATAEQRAILEVPTGEGWQAWETVSEGSPITPVFATDEELIYWLVTEGTHSGDSPWKTRVQWDVPFRRSAAETFVHQGWAPSMIVVSGPAGTEVLMGAADADKIAASKEDTP